MQYNKILSLIFLCLLLTQFAYPQEAGQIKGTVTDQEGQPIPGVLVQVLELKKGLVTEADGTFQLQLPSGEDYTLTFSFLGYESKQQVISKDQSNKNLTIQLTEAATDLQEFTILGKSELSEIREKAFNVEVVDARKLHHTNLDLGHALDRVSGVRVRESGGVGSRMNFSLNGFSGKQVKFLLMGFPWMISVLPSS